MALHAGIYHLNSPIFHLLQTLRNHGVNAFFVVIAALGDKYLLAAIYLIVLLFLAIRKQWYVVWHMASILFVSFGFLIVHCESDKDHFYC